MTAAVAALFHLLRDIEIENVITALREKTTARVVFAGVFVACGLVTLSAYDCFALRTIGRDNVPYRVAAFAGFTSYTIGHALGATVVTANAIRLRIYSAWELTVIDIAKIASITGLTVAQRHWAHRRGVDEVMCGHIHHAVLNETFGLRYINCGDWVESCTAAVEHFDGTFEIVRWAAHDPIRTEVEEVDAAEIQLGEEQPRPNSSHWKRAASEQCACSWCSSIEAFIAFHT